MTQADYPYAAVEQACSYDAAKVTKAQPTGYTYVLQNNAYALKVAIASGPVSVYVRASSFVFQFYSKGILNSPECGDYIDHVVTAIGYGKD
jgi:hypothetical protein